MLHFRYLSVFLFPFFFFLLFIFFLHPEPLNGRILLRSNQKSFLKMYEQFEESEIAWQSFWQPGKQKSLAISKAELRRSKFE